MNIIYTWFKNRYRKWYSEEFEILTLVISIKKASEYYDDITLYTNQDSLKYIEEYNLPIKIEIVEESESKLWVINKINTYEKQAEPFIHLDADCILLNRLPQELEKAQIGFQSKEDFLFYKDRLEYLVSSDININVNTEDVYNFGIYVCNDLSVNERYCVGVKKLIEEIKDVKPLLAYNIVAEQYTMSSLLKELNMTPSLLTENIESLEEKGILHLMHNKNSEEYFKKIKLLYETV